MSNQETCLLSRSFKAEQFPADFKAAGCQTISHIQTVVSKLFSYWLKETHKLTDNCKDCKKKLIIIIINFVKDNCKFCVYILLRI